MNNKCAGILKLLTLVLAGLTLISIPSFAATYDLVAKQFTTEMPDGATISMWGFALDNQQSCAEEAGWSVGPKLLVNPGEDLTVNLRNCLPEPVSIVIPGQEMPAGSAPVFHSSGPFTGRVRSFTAEADANGGTVSYSWLNFKPGTFVYHSGTHSQVQVQMGLYGVVTKNFAAGQAYNGVGYDKELALLFSEIDPDLHAAVADGSYGTTGPTSTLDYNPRYFLINGEPHTTSTPCLFEDGSLVAGEQLLLRMLNAGLREFAPMILGAHFEVVAEGGNAYPFPFSQYEVLLQPGSTKDILFTPTASGNYAIIDRRLNLTNNKQTGGGMQLCLAVGETANQPPIITSTPGTTRFVGVLYIYDVKATDPDAGDILTFSLDVKPNGMTINSTTGRVQWRPQANQTGSNNVTVRVTDSGGLFALQSYTINVSGHAPTITSTPVTTATVGAPYTYDVNANDADLPYGEVLTFSLDISPAGMIIDPSTGVIQWTPSTAGNVSVRVRVTDLAGLTRTQSFTIAVTGPTSSILLYFSTAINATVPGVASPYDDADIYSWNGSTFARLFDASAVGIASAADVDAVAVSGNLIYMSFRDPVSVPVLGTIEDMDIVVYNTSTASWTMYFDGSDVDLTTANEDVDSFELLSDGSILVSITASGSVPGVTFVQDEDLVRCVGTFGATTTCSWSLYFDGSDVALTESTEDIDGASRAASGSIYLSTVGVFNVNGLAGAGDDVFACVTPVTGSNTSCTAFNLYFDGSARGINDNLDAIDVP